MEDQRGTDGSPGAHAERRSQRCLAREGRIAAEMCRDGPYGVRFPVDQKGRVVPEQEDAARAFAPRLDAVDTRRTQQRGVAAEPLRPDRVDPALQGAVHRSCLRAAR